MKQCVNCGKELTCRQEKYCNSQCQQEYQYKQYIQNWKEGKESGIRGKYQLSAYIKRFIFTKYDNKCAKCGWSQMNPYTQTLPLEMHHIDGNYQNNQEDNLILLCPNCHSLTSTYKNANQGNGREDRR